MPGRNTGLLLACDVDLRGIRPRGDPKFDRKADDALRIDGYPDGRAIGILRLLSYRDRDAAGYECADFGRCVHDSRKAAVVRRHPGICGELGPALVHVCGAASEVRLKAEEVRVGTIRRPVPWVDA